MFKITNKTQFFDKAIYISQADACLILKAMKELRDQVGYRMTANDFIIGDAIVNTLKEIIGEA